MGSSDLPSEFVSQWTYDAARKAYRAWYFDSAGTVGESSGTWDENAKALILTTELGNGITATNTTRFVDPDTVEWTYVAKDDKGKVYSSLEGKWTRRK
jgi:hypothetical protein